MIKKAILWDWWANASTILLSSPTSAKNSGVLVASFTWESATKDNNTPPEVLHSILAGTDKVDDDKTITFTWKKNSHYAHASPSLVPVRSDDVVATSETELTAITADSHTDNLDGTVTSIYTYTFVTADDAKFLRFKFIPTINNASVQNAIGDALYTNYTSSVAPLFSPASLTGGNAVYSLRPEGIVSGAQWTNEGTLGGNAVTAGGSNAPNHNSVDGRMEFDQSNDEALSTPSGGSLSEVVEVWFKGKFTAGSFAMVMWGLDSGEEFRNTGSSWRSSGVNIASSDESEHVFRLVYNGSSSLLGIDGATPTAWDSGGVGFGTGSRYLGRNTSGSVHFNGYLTDWHVYNFALNSTDIAAMETYFGI